MLMIREDLNPKTLKEYASDLKHFVEWYKGNDAMEKEKIFRIEDVAASTLERYREDAHNTMQLKPATINRRLITLKRFF